MNSVFSDLLEIEYNYDPCITREEAASMLYRYIKSTESFDKNWKFTPKYTDLDQVAEWAYEAVCYLSMKEILNGKPNNIFDPKGNATRAEAAALIQKFLMCQ